MQVRINEKRTHKVINETVNGINVVAHLVASANNTDIPDNNYMTGTAFDPSNIQVDVQLKRNGKIYSMISSNLAILGHFNTIKKNQKLWLKGKVNVKKGASIKQQVERSLFIPFYGHHNIKGDDELIITVSVGRDAFGTGVDKNESSILVVPNQSIGIETAIYSFHTYALQAHMADETVNLGDNVEKIALLSFNKDAEKPIFKIVSLQSDRLDWTQTEAELNLRHFCFFPDNYADHLISVAGGEDSNKYYPNTYLIHDYKEIDQAKLKVSMHSANVESSENIVAWMSFETSVEILQKAQAMQTKHEIQNAEKVPVTLN